jgi:Icc-related predicted phosphoesterase
MIKILHVSDSHGRINFPKLYGEIDVVVHSGDFFPNFHYPPNPVEEEARQRTWLSSNIKQFQDWLGRTPFIFCGGNHCYADPCKVFNEHGIEAHNITERYLYFKGHNFYGFPWVPYDCLPWNYAIDVRMMQDKVEKLKDMIEGYLVDVLVTHCPPANILDRGHFGQRFGNTSLTNMLEQGLTHNPKALLCGHVHESCGITYEYDMLISNAACSAHRIELK